MKKILMIFLVLLPAVITMILAPNQVYAAYTDSVYRFEDFSETVYGVTLTIDEATQIFTINGTNNGAGISAFFPTNVYTANGLGYSLDSTKDYLMEYEYISGAMTTGTSFQPFIAIDKVESGLYYYPEILLQSTNEAYNRDRGIVIAKEYTHKSEIRGNTNNAFTNLQYKIHFHEVDLERNDFGLIDTTYNQSVSGITLNMTTDNIVTINGTYTGTSQIIHDLSPYLSTNIEVGKRYVVLYKYLSGVFEQSFSAQNPPASLSIGMTTHPGTYQYVHGSIIDSLDQFQIKPKVATTNGTITFDNLSYQILVQEIGLELEEPVIPGESTTPPNGVALVGSYYDGSIYYNRAEEKDTLTHAAYYVSTTEGSTFDFEILIENLHYAMGADSGARFVVTWIDSFYQEENISVWSHSAYDVVIYTNGDTVHVIHEEGGEANDAWSFAKTEFESFYFLIEKEPALISFYDGVTLLDTAEVVIGELITKPVDPIKEGFIFLGWELATEYRWNFSTDTVTDTEVNLYAVFVPDTTAIHTITFETNGGSLIDDLLVVDGELAVAPTSPTRTGYVFGGWYTDEALTNAFSFAVTIDESLTLYAKWTASSGGVVTPPTETSLSTLQIFGIAAVVLIGVAWFTSKKKKG